MSRPLPRRLPPPDPARIAREEASLTALRAQLLVRIDRLAARFEAKRLRENFRNGLPLIPRDTCSPEMLRACFAPDDPCLAALPSLAVS